MRDKAKEKIKSWWKFREKAREEYAIKNADHLAKCSCETCRHRSRRNPWLKGSDKITMQERKSELTEQEMMEEFMAVDDNFDQSEWEDAIGGVEHGVSSQMIQAYNIKQSRINNLEDKLLEDTDEWDDSEHEVK